MGLSSRFYGMKTSVETVHYGEDEHVLSQLKQISSGTGCMVLGILSQPLIYIFCADQPRQLLIPLAFYMKFPKHVLRC